MGAGGDSESFETYTRDYWLKLYAGMIIQGIFANNDLLVATVQEANEKNVISALFIATNVREQAQILVNEMFGDES